MKRIPEEVVENHAMWTDKDSEEYAKAAKKSNEERAKEILNLDTVSEETLKKFLKDVPGFKNRFEPKTIDISKDFDLIKAEGDIKIETPSPVELVKHPLGFAAVLRSSMVLCLSNKISYATKTDVLKTFFRLQMEMEGIFKCPELYDLTKEEVENFRFIMEHGQGSMREVMPKILASLTTLSAENK